MNEKVKNFLTYLGTFFAGVVSCVLYFHFSPRYRSVKRELKNATNAINNVERELTDLENKQLIVEDTSKRIRRNIDREREITNRVGTILADNDNTLSKCEGQLALCNAIIRESELILTGEAPSSSEK